MAQLVWELVKNNNAFLLKNNGRSFTTDPFSLTGRNTQLGLGFTTLNGVAVQAGEKQAIQTSLRRGQAHKAARKTGTLLAETLNVKGGVQRVARIVRKRFQTKGLRHLALRKVVNFHRANIRAQVAAKATKAAKKN